jgi:hypothetical protein
LENVKNDVSLNGNIDLIDSPKTMEYFHSVAEEILHHRKMESLHTFEIGKRLKYVKDNIVHGYWIPWLESIGMDRTEASRFMKVYEQLWDVASAHHLSRGILFELLPIENKVEFLEIEHCIPSTGEVKKVENNMTVKELREVKRNGKQPVTQKVESLPILETESQPKQYDDFVVNIADCLQNLIQPFREDLIRGAFQSFKLYKHLEISKLSHVQQYSMIGILELAPFANYNVDDVIEIAKLNTSKKIVDAFIEFVFEIDLTEDFFKLNKEYSEMKVKMEFNIKQSIKNRESEETIIKMIKETRGKLLEYMASGKLNAKQYGTKNKSSSTSNIHPHKILGIPDNATPAEAKKRFRQLSKLFHPDTARVQGIEGTEYLFQLVKEAHDSIAV